ncbi:type II toxin-antitoxin system antitoxin SocA domain-containing protein [Cupriavidus sp.]|uniref:Panacea domain-containing protein n=1 Tax=Cupriavidus sp. TaxID=1873897 RepID=UPI0025BC61DE|nr:type II toxin-antitoxin system antitoxin SocA domain-containing protein [Cupriavidus sp.]MCA3185991.1 SocA family protein [Cupriavidus sp.]MCA3193396.1 SocA family protein [Cupriavidus sp.]MCA3198198.1 SocA family protein [Cupriavidus sp.]MCA3204965.1 SocA family protein [Cupriavidus sp.]MCA3208584.1 SocA family protein [Cupriavidus sp.]
MWKFWKRKNWRKYDDTHDGKALAVAQYMLRRRQEAGAGLTLLQLTKLTYVAHGHMLARYMRPLYDEEIQAWPLGPMVPSVYYAVRHFRGRFIDAVPGAPTVAFDAQEREIMDMVADLYGCVDGLSLSSAMHHPGTPWRTTRDRDDENGPISNDLLANFYREILRKGAHHAL